MKKKNEKNKKIKCILHNVFFWFCLEIWENLLIILEKCFICGRFSGCFKGDGRNELKLVTQNVLKVLLNVLIHRIYWIYQVTNIDLEADCPTRKIGAFRNRSDIYDGTYHENSWQFLVISIADVWQCLKYTSAKSFPVTGFSWFLLTIAVSIFQNKTSMFHSCRKKQLIRKLLDFYNSL